MKRSEHLIRRRYKRGLSDLERARRRKEAAERSITAHQRKIRRLEKQLGPTEARRAAKDRLAAKAGKRKREREIRRIKSEVIAYAKLLGYEVNVVAELYDAAVRHRGYYLHSRNERPTVGYIFNVGWVSNLTPLAHGGWLSGVIRMDKAP